MLPIITDTALNALNTAAVQIQAALVERTGNQYDIRDLNDVLARWLEGSIESLCEDACELCVTGDRHCASFNHDAFHTALKRVPAVNVWDPVTEVTSAVEDQAPLALDRAA